MDLKLSKDVAMLFYTVRCTLTSLNVYIEITKTCLILKNAWQYPKSPNYVYNLMSGMLFLIIILIVKNIL